MKHFTIRQLAAATNGTYYGEPDALDREIAFVTSDSREVGAGALFVAFPGARVDGHDFMAPSLRHGAACCLSEREPKANETPCVRVESTLGAIGALAGWYRGRFSIPIVGVTGSVGKTTTKEMIAAVLSERFRTHKTEKNFNNALGVPKTLLALDKMHEAAVIEMGISDFGEMRVLTSMVRPTIAVMSVIGDSHLEFLGDRAGVLRAKSEIFESMGRDDLAVLNGDDAHLKDFYPPTRRVTYGLNPENDFVASDICNLGADGVRCTISHDGSSFDAYIPAFGVHMVYAALAGAAVGSALGMTNAQIARGIARYRTVGERARDPVAEDHDRQRLLQRQSLVGGRGDSVASNAARAQGLHPGRHAGAGRERARAARAGGQERGARRRGAGFDGGRAFEGHLQGRGGRGRTREMVFYARRIDLRAAGNDLRGRRGAGQGVAQHGV